MIMLYNIDLKSSSFQEPGAIYLNDQRSSLLSTMIARVPKVQNANDYRLLCLHYQLSTNWGSYRDQTRKPNSHTYIHKYIHTYSITFIFFQLWWSPHHTHIIWCLLQYFFPSSSVRRSWRIPCPRSWWRWSTCAHSHAVGAKSWVPPSGNIGYHIIWGCPYGNNHGIIYGEYEYIIYIGYFFWTQSDLRVSINGDPK